MPEVNNIDIMASDCSILQVPYEQVRALQSFNTTAIEFNCFNFKINRKPDDDQSLLEYDYKNNIWWTGRYIGEANFQFEDTHYRLSISPRFGELFLFKMFEEIYNIKLVSSNSKIRKTNDIQFLIRKVIAFIWVQLLANANKHGVPKNNITRQYVGTNIKGRISVAKSIQSLTSSNLITSEYREKAVDKTIAGILLQAYKILKTEYGLDTINIPDNAQEALNELYIEKEKHGISGMVSKHHYKTIQYRDIYSTYKAVVDFSWDIIEKKNILSQDTEQRTNKGFSFFIDMAEVWELYLKSLLKRRLQAEGWRLLDATHRVYSEMFYGRNLIPDIVFKKDGKVVAFDAKYKRMYFFSKELDRSDFFQIHTYSGYYLQEHSLVASGLLYPLTISSTSEELHKNYSKGLFGNPTSTSYFLVDGIDISFLNRDDLPIIEKIDMMNQRENEFLERIRSLVAIS
jgi:5-methylcytosine-specific restriction enzyme subunit McrC